MIPALVCTTPVRERTFVCQPCVICDDVLQEGCEYHPCERPPNRKPLWSRQHAVACTCVWPWTWKRHLQSSSREPNGMMMMLMDPHGASHDGSSSKRRHGLSMCCECEHPIMGNPWHVRGHASHCAWSWLEAGGCMVAAPPHGWWLLCDHPVSQTGHGVRSRVRLGPTEPPSARLETRIKESMELAHGCWKVLKGNRRAW